MIHQMAMVLRCGSGVIHPNCRVPVKALLYHLCLQARLAARERANLEHQQGTPEKSKERSLLLPRV